MPQTIALAAIPHHHQTLNPGMVAVIDADRSITWAELERRTNRAARALIARGVGHDDFVTIALPNSIDFIEACFACWKAGATPQPVSPRMPKAELDGIIALAKPALIVAQNETGLNSVGLDVLLAECADDSALPEYIASSWKAMASGGSTGRPKLIVAGQPAIAQFEAAEAWRLGPHESALMPGPLYHNGPFATAFCALMAGARLVILPRFESQAVLEQVAAHKITWLYLVPTMMNRIWRLSEDVKAKYDLSSLKTVWHLAAPCPPWLKEAWIEWLGADKIWELYGATESVAGTFISGSDWLTHRGSVGRAFTGMIKIFDESGAEAPSGVIGEVYMKQKEGAPKSYHYIGAEMRRRGEWQSLGDLGWMDDEGYLYLADRRTDMVIVGGSNVYPAEVEAALEEHPLVQSSAVIGLPDEDLGARIHAIVEPRAGLDVEELRKFIDSRLISYKRPASYEFVDRPLRDDAGKVRRSQLLQERTGAK